MQTQGTKIDFHGQNIYVGIDTHLRSWKVKRGGNSLNQSTIRDLDHSRLFKLLEQNH